MKRNGMTFGLSTVLSLGLLLLVGCSVSTEDSDTVDQDHIHQSYTAEFDAEQNRTTATAHFRFGGISGTHLRIVKSSKIEHNHYSLREVSALGVTFYSGDGAGFQPSHLFTWTTTEGKAFQNVAVIGPIDYGPGVPAVISRAAGAAIPFLTGVGPNERVVLTIRDDARSLSTTVSTSNVGDTSVTIPSTSLTKFFDGRVMIQLERVRSLSLQQGTSRGGYISTTYSTLKRAITLTP